MRTNAIVVLGAFASVLAFLFGGVLVQETENAPQGAAALKALELDWSSLQTQWDAEAEIPWEAAKCMVAASRAVYGDRDAIEDWFEQWGFAVAFVPEDPDSRLVACVATSEDARVISFRGSDDLYDFFLDLDIRLKSATPPADGEMHTGFYDEFERVEPELWEMFSGDDRRTWITGHSLGAALAVACARALSNEEFEIDGLVTFGQPRVVNPSLADRLQAVFEDRYGRFVNGTDVITRLPPRKGIQAWPPGIVDKYAHFGGLIALRDGTALEGSMYELSPLTEEEYQQLKGEYARRIGLWEQEGDLSLAGGPFFKDHRIEAYVERIQETAAR